MDKCESAFKTKRDLVDHVRRVHGDGENLNQNDIVIMSLAMSLIILIFKHDFKVDSIKSLLSLIFRHDFSSAFSKHDFQVHEPSYLDFQPRGFLAWICTPTLFPTVFFIATREEDFDAAKSRFSDVTAENEFKEKLGKDRKERGEEARPWVCVLDKCESAFKTKGPLVQHVRHAHGDGENLNQLKRYSNHESCHEPIILKVIQSSPAWLDFHT